MNLWLDGAVVRKILPAAAIGAAVIFAVNGMVLQPGAKQLEDARAKLARARADAVASGTLQMAQSDLEHRLSDYRAAIREVRRRSDAATDQRELFERVSVLARETNVDLEQVRSVDSKLPPSTTENTELRCLSSSCAIDCNGAFADIVSFVGAIESRLGLVAVSRLRVYPAVEGDRVNAELEISCFSMDRSAVATALSSVMGESEGTQ